MSEQDTEKDSGARLSGFDDDDGGIEANSTWRTKPITVRVDGGGKRGQLKIGAIIDQRFVLEKELGRGGMSVVYRALDLNKERAKDPNPHGALKILASEFSDDPDSWIALQREAKKTQALAHPRIVTVHDFQIDRDSGLPFFYMEELRGVSLDELMKNTPYGLSDRKQAIDIISSIAEGLDYAHSQGIVHSDLKPSNVFLTDEKQVKILDFGVARAVPGSDQDENEYEEDMTLALTPAYASCEMFDGEPAHPSDDLYALGVIAYEILTGDHPYREVLSEKNPALAARDAHLKPTRPAGLHRKQWHTLDKCLALERNNRPADAGAFLADFSLHSPVPTYLASLLVVLCGALIWSLWFRAVQLTPTESFEDLPLQKQEQFHAAIESGRTAIDFRDYNGALTYFIEAHNIHAHNPVAEAGLDQLIEVVMSQQPDDDRESIERKLEEISVLLSYDALAERRYLIKYRDELLKALDR